MAGRHLLTPSKSVRIWCPPAVNRLVHALGVPARRDTRGKQRLHLRRDIKRVVVPGIEERLDAESIAGREQRWFGLIPDHEGKFAAQLMQALRPQFFV